MYSLDEETSETYCRHGYSPSQPLSGVAPIPGHKEQRTTPDGGDPIQTCVTGYTWDSCTVARAQAVLQAALS